MRHEDLIKIRFGYDEFLLGIRRRVAPSGKFCRTTKTWSIPYSEANRFIDEVDRLGKYAGKRCLLGVDGRDRLLGSTSRPEPPPRISHLDRVRAAQAARAAAREAAHV
jgi:hypothetical protein